MGTSEILELSLGLIRLFNLYFVTSLGVFCENIFNTNFGIIATCETVESMSSRSKSTKNKNKSVV